MCGRYTYRITWAEIHRLARLTTLPLDPFPSFNVAPTQLAPVVRELGGARSLDMLRWGLVPFWAADLKIGNSLINARADTVATKPAFRAAFKARRCLVPASGFYEWQKPEGHRGKQPYHVSLATGDPMFFAGLWERWDKGGEPVETYAILTTDANEHMAPIHHRIPVIVDPADFAEWLSADAKPETITALLRPCPPEKLVSHPVSTRVNSPRYNAPECIEPLVEL